MKKSALKQFHNEYIQVTLDDGTKISGKLTFEDGIFHILDRCIEHPIISEDVVEIESI